MSQSSDAAWSLVREAARTAEAAARGDARSLPQDGEPVLTWNAEQGWESRLPQDDPRSPLLDLYLPICSATRAHPITIGHLGQSLDGFIATHSGESQYVTGGENILHLHRMRALCDAVIVGAGTVAADNPRLTTRLVPGPNPLRVVLDPERRLASDQRVFSDGAAETIYVCARSLAPSGSERFGQAAVAGVDGSGETIDIGQVVALLRGRGCARIFVEGGGVTVSAFLEAQLLDRLHLAIAPLLIGNGRAAIRLPAPSALDDCHRPGYRVFRMGGDVLFDCDLRSRSDDDRARSVPATIARII